MTTMLTEAETRPNRTAPFLRMSTLFRVLDMLPVVLNFGEDMTVDELIQNQGTCLHQV